jgi:nitroimidazol reductase NimA-like FMN-containing flavoprotein (pyridoxamine 5'-phosphate oxidase superfamily)
MGHDELREFLRSDNRLVVATQDKEGTPWVDAVACHFATERMYFCVAPNTRTQANIEVDPRVCCVMESKPTISSYYDIKGAMLHGTVEKLADEGEIAQAVRAALAQIEDPVTKVMPAAGTIYSVDLLDSTSFAFEKIAYRYEDRSLT